MKKMMAVLVATGLSASLLCSCGQKAATEGTTGNGSSAETKKAEEKKEGKEVTLKVFDSMAYGIESYDALIKKFEEQHPGVKVEIQHAANDGNTILQSRVNSGDIPDVFLNEPGAGAKLYYEYSYDWSKDKDLLSKFNEDALNLTKTDEGAIYGLPWTYETMALIYNKDVFDKAGIKELPNSVEELGEICKTLKSNGVQPISLPGKEKWVLGQLATHFIMDKSLDAEGTVEALKSGKKTFKDLPHWDNFFKFLDLVKEYDGDKAVETGWEPAENAVATGEAAMLHMGDWAQANFTKMGPDTKLAFMPVPVGTAAEDNTILSSVGWVFQVYKDSPNLDLAKEYCEYVLCSEDGAKWMTEGVDAVPANNTTELQPTGDLPQDAQKYIKAGKTNGWIHTICDTTYSDTVGPLIQGYLLGEYSKEDVTQGFEDYFKNLK
nr:extracellular solute-binding protein [uncultured Oribacterium sp.]